jgi:hypothetical protein
MKSNISKHRVTVFTRKTNVSYYAYKMHDSSTNRKRTIKGPGVQLDSNLHFHARVDCICSKSVEMLGLIRTVADSLSTMISY